MDHNLCVLIDFDNIAKGSRLEGLGEFDIRLVMRRLKDIGRVLVARAYCDWDRWPRHRQMLAEQGVTMIELPATGHGDKNRGDIALVVDAMEIAFSRDFLDTFVILSGDSDFTPLVLRLKELNRSVIGIGTRGSTSRLIANVCDEFFFYDTLVRQQRMGIVDEHDEDERGSAGPGKLKLDVAFNLLTESLENHARDEAGPVHASVVKTSMKRKLSTFNENDLGVRTFARFLERAQAEGLVTLSRDGRAGGYRVELAMAPGEDRPGPAVSQAPPQPQQDPGPAPEVTLIERDQPTGEAAAALTLLRDEGLDIGTSAERRRILEAFVSACNERVARGRRLAVQYLQGDLVQSGYEPELVRGVLGSLGRLGALLHADGDPVRGPTSPMQPPPPLGELNALLEERALEILGGRLVKLDAEARLVLFGDPEADRPAGGDDESSEDPSTEGGVATVDAEPAPAPEETAPPAPKRAPRRRLAPRVAEADPAESGGSQAELPPAADAPDGDLPRRRGRRGGGRSR